MTILDKIIQNKKEEVAVRKKYFPKELLADGLFYDRKTLSLVSNLTKDGSSGIIAEYKRKSPSKGIINTNATVTEVVEAYNRHGAAGVSILTDEQFFGGTWGDLLTARKSNIPILRKDFIIDEYQVTESKLLGADVILLIAACLSVQQTKELAQKAKETGLEVLLELHNEDEFDHICIDADMIGINCRNLKTFEVNREEAFRLAKMLDTQKPKIAESGINSPESITALRQAGFEGFLIGEMFMKAEDPGAAFELFVKSFK